MLFGNCSGHVLFQLILSLLSILDKQNQVNQINWQQSPLSRRGIKVFVDLFFPL